MVYYKMTVCSKVGAYTLCKLCKATQKGELMKRKQVLALLLAVCLSSSLLPVPILATEGAAETVQAVAEEGTEPSDSGVKSASDLETEPGDERESQEPTDESAVPVAPEGEEAEQTDPTEPTEAAKPTEPAEQTEPTNPVVMEELAEFPVETLGYSQGSTVIQVQQVDEQYYLFLPASADSKQLKLNCDLKEGQRLYVAGDKNPDGTDATEGVALDAVATAKEGQYTLKLTLRTVLEDGTIQTQTKEASVQVMQSANLSAVYLTSGAGTGGRTHMEKAKENAIKGSMAMIPASGKEPIYDGALTQIKARGSSTFKYYPKKSYQIKLDKKTKLISGTEKGKTWVLLAGYTDAVKLSDQMWKEVGVAVNAPYTARAEHVDLYFDGEYRGIYVLSEKNQINGNRIDITDMEKAYEGCNDDYGNKENKRISSAKNRFKNLYYYTNGLTDPEQKGGFLLELNGVKGDEASWFKTSMGYGINVKSPEFASQDTMLYISEYFQEFEDALRAQNADGTYTGRNPTTGRYYYDYCDLDSLVQQYLLNTVASNRDGFWRSLYFYMDTDGMMYAGPMWDMELTMGVGWLNAVSADRDCLVDTDTGGGWCKYLIQIPSFRAALKAEYEAHFADALSALLGDSTAQAKTGLASFQERAERARASVAMDHVLWPQYLQDGAPYAGYPKQSFAEYKAAGNVAKFHVWPNGTTYDTIVQARVQWLTKHKQFLDRYFGAMDGSHVHVFTATGTAKSGNQHSRVCRECGATVQEACGFTATGKATAPTAKSAGVCQGKCPVCGRQRTQKVTLEQGESFRSGSLYYQVSAKDQTVTVTKGTKKTLTSVSIPATVSYGGVKYRVTAIGAKAFQKYTKLKSASIGANVKTIGEGAFESCTALTKLIGCAGVETIGKKAFCWDKVLKSVPKLSRCKTVGAYAFYRCYKLTTLSTGTAITSVGAYAFGYDSGLTKVRDLRKCASVGDGAFYGCKKLRQIGGTKNRVSLYRVSTIGKKAFQGCTAMTNFYEGGSLTKLGENCFYGDKKLKTITLNSKKLTQNSVGKNAFKGIYSKATIRVPGSKKKVYLTYLKGKGQGKKVSIKGM